MFKRQSNEKAFGLFPIPVVEEGGKSVERVVWMEKRKSNLQRRSMRKRLIYSF
jgi:hypothetical protein